MDYVYLVIVLALIEYLVFVALVGRARGKYGIRAPAITGHEIFDRTFRVQQNTLEGLIVLVPALWIAGTYWDPIIAAVVGLVWILARVAYAITYIRKPASRGPASIVLAVAQATLLIGSLVALLRAVF